ncbi:MAG: hypothetical protein OEM28_11860 [Nitrosopumilus sp.]|nr:hypothetical protein [Nitrosopumilus sp.]MDH3487148.1 hypothetical protein [Nitrosopumilus sp.]
MYVDLVGSAQMVMDLPQKQLAMIVSSFAQEMGYVIKQHNGYILKSVGDAVIGYFAEKDGPLTLQTAQLAVQNQCSR